MSERGTLTLLDDRKFILGLPENVEIGEKAREYIKNQIKLWSFDDSNLDLLIFPFPIDVIDLRTKHDRPKELDTGTD